MGKAGSNKRDEYTDVSLDASDLSYTSQFPLTFEVKTPGNGTLKLTGKAGPLNQRNAAATPVDASLEVRNLDLATTGFMDCTVSLPGRASM